MKKMDSLGLSMCRWQAELFESSFDKLNCSTKIFIRRFMLSEFAERFDKNGILFENFCLDSVFEELENQYGYSDYGKDRFPKDELYWIGYIYRYWSYVREISSKKVFSLVKPDTLANVFSAYHSFDPLQAIERIEEDLGIVYNDITDIARGVEILRAVRSGNIKHGKK